MPTFGPNYSSNASYINNYMVAGATLIATPFFQVFTNLNNSSASMGDIIGNTDGFSYAGSPFGAVGPTTSLVQNIITAYNAAVSATKSSLDVGVFWIL